MARSIPMSFVCRVFSIPCRCSAANSFRLWYLFGAILVAAWLGQGTVYLLARRRIAYRCMAVLAVASSQPEST